ncbi:response regulator transcription factor [Paenibacillus alba]|uniref:Response regulator n=1 Tax=Paenibacillus alba TaxID=1197127 RepID=A0ABU6G3H6_9BACL|nr:response regulator [Paenibacillus alba]MEC0228710.1 response regulator [Paenibacillus alba]
MRTFRCLIVDDEDLILQRLESFFKQFGSKYELVGKAYSGQEAIDMALDKRPDIVLTDIVMPGMDGIEMIELLKPKLPPATAFIILTAYSDFVYAKRAIRQNVLDYITKVPLEASVIRSALDEAAEEITVREQTEGKLYKLQRSSTENLYRLRRQVLGELLRGEASAGQIQNLSEELRVERELKAYYFIVLELCDYASFKQDYSAKDQSVLKYALLNIIEETIGRFAKGFACEISEERMLGVVSWLKMSSYVQNEEQAVELGQTLQLYIGKYLKRNVNIAYSEIAYGWNSFGAAYRRASSKIKDTYYMEDGAILGPSYRTTLLKGHEQAIHEELRNMFKNLQTNTPAEVIATSFERIASLAKEGKVDREHVEGLLRGLLMESEERAFHWNNSMHIFPSPSNQLLIGKKFAEQLQLCLQYVLHVIAKQPKSLRAEILKAKNYINLHIDHKLSLEEVALFVNLTPSYFSSLFKRETGENLVDYMNRSKVERALELLKQNKYTNLQLGEAVGIYNEKYFCTLFKHHFGQTPQKFRKQFIRN